ncbi:sensor histidine kinase [Pedobacter sp. CFBP9032]|uniref:sensor histidine kinase n=1 Tax=Pedobacter sp. CFBP9032 TaxID=3096539 RepID=UPI002A6A66C5|nr:histidine kinase [Pedobacter sp. CFBP9032]MDY0905124.1 histidine kinase [Pedobacter sp. CFBP9032]
MKSFVLRKSWLHILIWSIFIGYETIIVGVVFGIFGNPLTYIAHYTIIICYFYLLSIKGLNWALNGKGSRFFKLPAMLIIAIASYILINFIADNLLIRIGAINHVKRIDLDEGYILKEIYRCIYFTGLATAFYFLSTYLKEREKTVHLERMRLQNIIAEEKMQSSLSKAQNDFLRAQINPHFLFNSLNCVYHNIDNDPDLAKEAIIIVSEIMRYAVEASHNNGLILVNNEVNQARKLAKLHKIRTVGNQFLEIYMDEEAVQYYIIPLVILTLTENIFKHGNLNDLTHEAMISVFMGDDKLHIHSTNKINENPSTGGTNSGLSNIRERLSATYGNGFYFHCETENDTFNVRISIQTQTLKRLNK